MFQLPELLRQLLYHVARLGRQGGVTTATVVAVTGFNLFGPGSHMSLLEHLKHPLGLMVSVVGSAVIFNITLKHFNEVLKRLVKEGHHTEDEFKQTLNLIRALFGRPPKVDDERHADVKETNSDSKNSADDNSADTK